MSTDRTLKVWDKRQQKPVHVIRCKEELINGVFSPDGGILATHGTCNSWDDLTFYDPKMWQETGQIKFKTEVEDFMWDHTGIVLFVDDLAGSISLFDGGLQC